jgi:purine-binding chemotaxis protein CheW
MEYVSFRLGTELYALDVWHAREIVDAPPVSQLPNAPDWIAGLMNLRGRIVPVVDLKRKFDLGDGGQGGGRGYVIVVDVESDDGTSSAVGVLADAVLEVFDLGDAELTPPPKFGARFSRAYLRGLIKRETSVIAVMDAARVLADADAVLETANDVAPQSAADDSSRSAS